MDLNLGKITIEEAIKLCSGSLDISEDQMTSLMDALKKSQTPIPGSVELLKKLQTLVGINLYSITDNIKELIEYHKRHSEFPRYFKDIIVSADLGILKPDPRIYKHLLDKHNLIPTESVFIDDLITNVNGALSIGMHAFQFTNMIDCEKQLIKLY
jgi:putative hydrolase of the HAD superfamily